ncbi:hypothetical protein [Flavobacterium sp.]|uniref:hypothetical protein n=1 Tax=Flavobacterium sp. TaxID=239 RepID=UPI003750D134
MKKFVVLFFLIIVGVVHAQKVDKVIILKDAETNLPIEDVTVVLLKTKQLFLSNVEGKVSFDFNGNTNIQISHTSYITTTVRLSNLKDKETIIFLKNNVNDLEEIIITKQHPQKILLSLIENSKKKLTTPSRLKIYSREFFKINGEYSYYNDGLMNFQISEYSKKFNTDILVEQNRSFGLVDANVTNDLLGYNLNDIMENYYNFKYLNPVLEPKAKKDYDFLIKGYSPNKDYYIITIIPLDEAKGLLDDVNVIYDYKKKIIIEATTFLNPSTVSKSDEKTAVGSKNIYKSNFKNIYKFDGSAYYLVSSKEEIGFDLIEKKGKKNIEVRNYFVTTNFSNQNYSFKESDVFKDKTLFNKKNVILTDYWNVSGITATKEEVEIIDSIKDLHK